MGAALDCSGPSCHIDSDAEYISVNKEWSIVNDAFNANFYIVTATINPIFFLALTIQGSFYGGLIEKINAAGEAMKRKGHSTSWRDVWSQYVALGAWTLALAILASGIGSEITAIFALCYQHADNNEQSFVLWSTVGIIILTAATPGWSMVRAYFNWEVAGTKNNLGSLSRKIKEIKRLRSTSRSGLIPESRPEKADDADQPSRASGNDT